MPQNGMQCMLRCNVQASLSLSWSPHSATHTPFTLAAKIASERMASSQSELHVFTHSRRPSTYDWVSIACVCVIEFTCLCVSVSVRQQRERRNWQTERDSPLTRIPIMMKSQRARLTLKSALRLYYIYTHSNTYLFCWCSRTVERLGIDILACKNEIYHSCKITLALFSVHVYIYITKAYRIRTIERPNTIARCKESN